MHEIGKDILLEKKYIKQLEIADLISKKQKEAEKRKRIASIDKKDLAKKISLTIILSSIMIFGATVGEPTEEDIKTQEAYTQELILKSEQEKNKEVANQLIEEDKLKDRIAFYIQNADIKENGSITKPEFFKYIPDEYKDIIIFIKDKNVEQLKSYQKRKIDPDNRIIFEAEITHKQEFFENRVLSNNIKLR